MIGSKILRFGIPAGVKELRFHFCQTGESGVPVKKFLTDKYSAIKKSNPDLPIMVREAHGVSPTLYARFELGRESKYSLEGLDGSGIEKTLKGLK